jgi:uncharacterized protein (UPF0335 family)
MNFNKIVFLGILVFLQNSLDCAQDLPKSDNSTTKNTQYKGKKIETPLMKIFNSILVQHPTTTLRMTVAAQRAQVILNNIEKLKPVGVTENGEPIYFGSKQDQQVFVAEQLKSVLEPVERFFENVKEHMAMVKGLLGQSLTEGKLENSVIYKILTNVKDSFLEYSCSIISSVPELEKAAREFVVFFADVNASLDEDAKKAFFTFIKNNPNILGKK